MVTPRTPRLGLRSAAVLPIILFTPSLVSFAVAKPGVLWPEYTGVFFHLAVLALVARLDAPAWARAAGCGWITLDVLAGVMSVNAVPYDVYWPVRLGGHVLAGTWILTSSLVARPTAVRIVGAVTGVWLGGYSFIAHTTSIYVLYPAALLIVVWFAVIALTARRAAGGPDAAVAPVPARAHVPAR